MENESDEAAGKGKSSFSPNIIPTNNESLYENSGNSPPLVVRIVSKNTRSSALFLIR